MEHPSHHAHGHARNHRDIRSWIDPILLVSFILTALTGLTFFFHLYFPGVGWLHQWAGNVFVLAAVAHLLPNAKGLWRQIKTPFGVLLAVLTLAALALGTWLSLG